MSNKNTNSPEPSNIDASQAAGEQAHRPPEKIREGHSKSKSQYLVGPYLGVVAHIEIIDASENSVSYLGEVLDNPYVTYKLKVFVNEMNSTCGELKLPVDKDWEPHNMRAIKKLPDFVGQHKIGDNRANEPKIGDIVAIEYHDPKKPARGGIYLGIAYSKHGTHNLSRMEAIKEFKRKVTNDHVSTLYDTEKQRTEQNLGSKACIKTTSIPNVGFLSENNRFMINPSPNTVGFVDKMLYGQICMLGFNSAGTAIDFNKEIAQVYDPDLKGSHNLSTKGLLKKIPFKGKFIEGTRTLTVHEKVELAFRMVFKQLDYMYDSKDKDILDFKIKTIGGYRLLECVSTGDYNLKLVTGADGVKGCKLKINKDKLKKGDIRPYPLGVSRHCFGLAIDVNAKWNPQVDKDRRKGKKEYQEWLGKDNHYKIPDKVIQVFKYYGFRWGGNFNRKDLHHFDFIGDPDSIIPAYAAGFKALRSPEDPQHLVIGVGTDPWNRIIVTYDNIEDTVKATLKQLGFNAE